jgi:hypothetical protein
LGGGQHGVNGDLVSEIVKISVGQEVWRDDRAHNDQQKERDDCSFLLQHGKP